MVGNMKKIPARGLCAALIALFVAASASNAFAQVAAPPTEDPTAAAGDDSWYYRSAPERSAPVKLSVQKAQQRGAQRMARLEAMRWYGFSNSRPTASAMPWTTMYSPAWQMPGGRPFAWYMTSRPVIVINQTPVLYR
jgi:hypothetical protein